MKALCWHGMHDVRVQDVPDPQILNPGDAIVKVTSTAICGSDLHLYDGVIPSMMAGDILGHEFMGTVMQIGKDVKNLRSGDRVVVPFPIACGQCFFCAQGMFSLCDNTNPKAGLSEAMYGFSGSGIFGYSHLMGGYAGGQAEYVRVPFADVGPIKISNHLTDEQVLFLSDIFPTGFQAVEQTGVTPKQTVAVWGCGPVGQFVIQSARMLGVERVIAIDRVPERMRMACEFGQAEVINADEADVVEALKELTGGRGPDVCIDAVGMESHGYGLQGMYDNVKTTMRLQTDRPFVLREVIQSCRKGGVVSLAGVYGGFVDKMPIGAAFAKGLTFKMGQTHVHRYLQPLLNRIEAGDIDPSFIITHRLPLEEGPAAYQMFKNQSDECIKVVLKP